MKTENNLLSRREALPLLAAFLAGMPLIGKAIVDSAANAQNATESQASPSPTPRFGPSSTPGMSQQYAPKSPVSIPSPSNGSSILQIVVLLVLGYVVLSQLLKTRSRNFFKVSLA